MAGIIGLAGGNEFRNEGREMDRILLERLGKSSPKVVILPTAAVRGSPKMAAANGAFYFRTLNALTNAALVLSREDAFTPRLYESLQTADMVYISGGDPNYLMDTLAGSALYETLRALHERGVMIVGSSAGAMVLSTFMREGNTGSWKPGLGWAKLAILVHHHVGTTQMLSMNAPNGLPVVGIAESTACFSADGSTWEVAGAGYVTLYQGSPVHFKQGETFSLTATPS